MDARDAVGEVTADDVRIAENDVGALASTIVVDGQEEIAAVHALDGAR
jgi:hypothetical protein